MIIISASGMCESGRILHHLKNNIEDPRNTVLFVAFQAQHTLGRRIRDGAEAVNIFGGRYDVRARVEVIDGYSAHADHEELLGYVRRLGRAVAGAYIVHGEEEAALALKRASRARCAPGGHPYRGRRRRSSAQVALTERVSRVTMHLLRQSVQPGEHGQSHTSQEA